MTRWGESDIGRLEGRRIVVTGANSGIGREAARLLLAHGAEVVLACRDEAKGKEALSSIGQGAGRAEVARLDLASFDSIASFAEETGPMTDLLNNAGVMACPLAFTADGLELQMGTNHFGHALLTALLLPKLADGGRVVFVTSIASRTGRLTADMTAEDLTSPTPYSPQRVYSNTKQANLLYSQELGRRLRAAGRPVSVLAAHPGVSATELFLHQLRASGKGFLVPLVRPAMQVVLPSAKAGSLPSLRALVDPSLEGGELIGPHRFGDATGPPERLRLYRKGADPEAARRLFELTEAILGVDLLGAS